MRRRLIATTVFAVTITLRPDAGGGQSLTSRLSTLITEQQPSPPFVPDVPAAEATRDTLTKLIAVELSNLPTSTSSGGFVYRLNSSLGVVERASEGFGPIFTERVLRNSEGQLSAGFSYQFSTFSSLQGADLNDGTFQTNVSRLAGASQPLSVDRLDLSLESRTASVFSSYGVTERFTVGASLPFSQVQLRGSRVRTTDGRSVLQSAQSGSATGFGDLSIRGRYMIAGSGPNGVALGGDLRLPSGSKANLLGTGRVAGRVVALASFEEGRLGVNVNGAFGVGGVTREGLWSMATTFAPAARVTIVGEVLGRYLSELNYMEDVYQPHASMPDVETMRWLPTARGFHTTLLVTGAKWNVASGWLLNASLLTRLTDGGLRARLTPTVSVDYDFGP